MCLEHMGTSMNVFLSRVCAIGLVATLGVGATGCGHYGHHHHGGDGMELLAAGLVVGAAVGALATKPSPPEPEYVYVSNPYAVNVAPLPRSPRDDVRRSDDLPSFDPQAARAAFNTIDVAECRSAGAPSGYGHARVTINPDGRVSKVVVDEPAGLSAEAVRCIGDRLGTATVAPFKGSLVTMGTSFHLP
ncbi:MAG TPA: hypothetical protein VM925_07355 [Labilithrix sp.]|nr:hypothetical protein [Labilithrix sp.]